MTDPLVEKKGSNSRSSASGATPLPVSATLSATQRPGSTRARQDAQCQPPSAGCKRTRIRPWPSIASRALMHKLNRTCSSCTGSAVCKQIGLVDRRLDIDADR
jgi:hypothetical protein